MELKTKDSKGREVTINFQGEVKNYGTIIGDIYNPTFNFGRNNAATSLKVKAALQKLFDEGLVTDKTQWYAIYRCLKDKNIAPGKPADFETYINSLGIDFPIPCQKDKYRNVVNSYTRLKIDVSAWTSLTAPSAAENSQITVAKRLLELLEE